MSNAAGQGPYIGEKIKPERAGRLLRGLAPYLAPYEAVLTLASTNKLRPLLDHLIVTSVRIAAFDSSLERSGFKLQVMADDIARVELRSSGLRMGFLVVTRADGTEIDFGDLKAADARIVESHGAGLVRRPQASPAPGKPDAQWHYNSPPGWPPPPPGWTPPPGWQPDPSWPSAPQGWRFWSPAPYAVERPAQIPTVAPHPAPAVPHFSVPHTPPPVAAPPPIHATPASAPVAPPAAAPPAAGARRGRGLFGDRKRVEELEAEVVTLREQVARLLGMDAHQLAQEKQRLVTEVEALRQQAAEAGSTLDELRRSVVRTEEIALLQEAGIYEYRHPLEDAVAYKARLAQLRDRIKAMARQGGAVLANTNWEVNGSKVEGRRMVTDYTKLMLRAYNAEADGLVRSMRPYKLHSARERLEKTANVIAKLGRTMDIRVSPEYHRTRLEELDLTADYLAKVEEEKERIREEREQEREEAKARREFELEKARLLREQSHYEAAIAKLEAKGDLAAATELRTKLGEVGSAIADVEGREANIRAGYVYVISNVGAFGERMVKVGLTRRLDPQDRVRELGDASVPFRFDVHALIFSEDAVGLEAELHGRLADRRVNRVNLRREFFYASPADVREILEGLTGPHLLEYRDVPEALEWRASSNQESSGGMVLDRRA